MKQQTNVILEQLQQLTSATWDGDLMSKETRDHLVGIGLIERAYGYNWLTTKGVEYCVNLQILKP